MAHERRCFQHAFSSKTRNALVNLASTNPKKTFTSIPLDGGHLVNPNPFGAHFSRLHYLDALESAANDVPNAINKVMILEKDRQQLKKIEMDPQGLLTGMASSLSFAFEINPPGITKANALVTLLRNLHLENLPVFAVGDGENDLSYLTSPR